VCRNVHRQRRNAYVLPVSEVPAYGNATDEVGVRAEIKEQSAYVGHDLMGFRRGGFRRR
jgi:hypothetical protein